MRIRFHVASVLILTLASVLAAGQSRPSENPRLDKLKEWMALVEQHQPGAVDPAVEAVRFWDREWLQDVRDDLYGMRESICAAPRVVGGGRCPRLPINVRGTQQLASHAVVRSQRAREWVGAYTARHLADLERLAIELDRQDINDILKRGALLHTDIAFRADPVVTWSSDTRFLFLQKTSVNTTDGRESGMSHAVDHLEMARRLLDIVTPDPRKDLDTFPERDAMVREWYRATIGLLVAARSLDIRHKTASTDLLQDDDEVLFLAGAMHETLASPSFQRGVTTRSIRGVTFVEAERTELSRAEDLFRRALKVNPGHVEARVRLGQVLAQRGQTAEALGELRTASGASRDPLVSYYAALLIGREEADVEPARAAFRRAATLYPTAQSPRIGLSEVAMRSGNRRGAAQEIETIWTSGASPSRDDDPWSSYFTAAGRRGNSQLDAINAAFSPTRRPR
ncbi:MAG TPA: tetratricopeptide repeat protein [Vicinamibacterales bacterium]|nr:tetratricopeptide repeat protein [Vicinamibacterales bacterium]